MNSNTLSRWIALNGAFNARDLGGYPAAQGQTRWRAFVRADSQHRLSPEDRQALIDYGVRTVIDLRHADELESAPTVWHDIEGVTYINIPMFRFDRSDMNAGTPPRDLASVYRFMVDQCQVGLREALVAVADANEGGVLFHCTAGKDRTGVLAALMLAMVGVSPETIIEDYALTTQAMMKMRPIILAQVEAAGGKPEMVDAMLGSEPADMRALLDYLDDTHGGAAAYLKTLGITPEQQARIRARLVDIENDEEITHV